jgi:DNA invertase Pin-like site-specific DNA recombinase
MRKIGYARVSSSDQNLDRQIVALRAEGCDEIFREKVSGKSMKNRPELERAIDMLATGDVLVVAEWDRATRSMIDGIEIITRINKRGSMLKVLDRSYLDLTTEIGRGVIALLSAIAADERQRILNRCAGGRKAAKSPRRPDGSQAQALGASAPGSPQAAGSGRKRSDHREVVRRPPCDCIIGGRLKKTAPTSNLARIALKVLDRRMDKDLLIMTDDELEQFCTVRVERLGNGRYAVFGEIEVGDKVEKRRIECSNPAWGTAQLEEQLSELLLAHERAKAKLAAVPSHQ